MKFFSHPRLALGFVFVCVCLGAPLSRAADSDEQILANFQVESARLKREVHEAGEDMAKVADLQKQMQALIKEVMGKVSPKSRTAFEVSLQVINPLMDGGIVYTEALQKYMDASGFDYTSATSTKIIDRRLEELAKLEKLNEGLLKRAISLETDIEAVLKASKMSAGEQASFLKGFQSSMNGRIGAMRAVRTLDARLYVEVRGIYGQLREQLGKWAVKEDVLTFEDDAQATIYNSRIERINVIAERQEVAQRRALDVK
ncbi:hypothetical protein [Rariglobus hedericola]|uniref:TerB family tellurite resistance protein n=1 Tax=Rariglobus hedericola TaxID=2597822 RepID=A0A556QSL2_9BACT|nr:hypothetical protein [Rariglobus hedericola]TSJ79626.1 hypothetical protein FPL22_10170 [Rariglobus hedericola]